MYAPDSQRREALNHAVSLAMSSKLEGGESGPSWYTAEDITAAAVEFERYLTHGKRADA